MRYDKRYTRVLGIIIDPQIPRFENGSIRLCHFCQRNAMFAGSFIQLLINRVRLEAGEQLAPWRKW